MKIYEFDIWDGDKGIIVAESFLQACELYHKQYKEPICVVDTDEDYDSGICRIAYVYDVPTKPTLLILD